MSLAIVTTRFWGILEIQASIGLTILMGFIIIRCLAAYCAKCKVIRAQKEQRMVRMLEERELTGTTAIRTLPSRCIMMEVAPEIIFTSQTGIHKFQISHSPRFSSFRMISITNFKLIFKLQNSTYGLFQITEKFIFMIDLYDIKILK